MRAIRILLVLGGFCALAAAATGFAAETTDPVPMRTTLIALKVDADVPLPLRTSFQAVPPTLTIGFPGRRVTSSLPERSVVGSGIIQHITAGYESGPSRQGRRVLSSLQIVLSAPYAYRVRSEPGQVVVEIRHPASAGRASAMEVGLRGGTMSGGLASGAVTERFRAMQKALAFATSTPVTLQVNDAGILPALSPTASEMGHSSPGSAAPSLTRPQAAIVSPSSARRRASGPPIGWWLAWLAAGAGCAACGAWCVSRSAEKIWASLRVTAPARVGTRPASGVVLVDQLVWRAFERQGYQLTAERELTEPPLGTFRVIMKDGAKAALLFVGYGPLFEKQTVERFLRAMREASTAQGFLVAAGSFTVPAQRIAKEHQVALIEREQLTELLSVGAGSEHFATQLEQGRVRFEEAQQQLRRYADELDALRRQRNEASWYLGEERAKSAALDTQLAELGRQVGRYEATITQWEQEAAALRKQWDESQWYLGESQNRVRHAEGHLAVVQERAAQLHEQFQASVDRGRALQGMLDQLAQELKALHTYGERRRRVRVVIPATAVELLSGEEGSALSIAPRNISGGGLGLESDRAITADATMRVRLRLPDQEPIESKAQLKWQRAEGVLGRYQSGCRWIGLPASTRALIEQLVAEAQSSPM